MQVGVEPHRQRWFYAGRMLNDKLRMEDAKIPRNHVVQVIVSEIKDSWDVLSYLWVNKWGMNMSTKKFQVDILLGICHNWHYIQRNMDFFKRYTP